MTNNPSHNKQSSYRSPILWGLATISAVLLGCLVLSAICWSAGPKSPVSPPLTEFGSVPTFDNILAKANEDWRFLFVFKGQLLLTDIYGQSDQVLLNFSDAIGNKCYSLLWDGSLSPDSNYLITQYDIDEYTEAGDLIGSTQ